MREPQPASAISIVVFGEERYAAYDRVHLSEYFAGRSAESLSLVADDFFHRHGIELRLGEAVATIDRDARLVRDAEGMKPTGINWCWRPALSLCSAGAGQRSRRVLCLPHP
jgi:NAD(P)H-nitrite reductase large subunit